MALTIVETRSHYRRRGHPHADTHVAAALDPGRRVTRRPGSSRPRRGFGYALLLGWLNGFGSVCLVGIEGTGSYGAGLARHVAAAGIRVVEVDRSDRQDRRRQGKSDPLDAVSAASRPRAVRPGGRMRPRGRDGAVEAIRALMVAKRSAMRSERTQTINQARALVVTGPDDIRARFARHSTTALVAELAALRPRPGDVVGYATRVALREAGTPRAVPRRSARHRLLQLPRTARRAHLAHPAAARPPKRHHHHRPVPHQRRAPRPADHRPASRTREKA